MIKLTEAREMTTTMAGCVSGQPAHCDIQRVLNLLEKPTATVNEIWKKTNDVVQTSTAKSV
jgi:hypothetical protein